MGLKLAILLIVGAYVAVAAYMYVNQRRFIYFPDAAHVDPVDVGLSGVEEHVIATPDGERVVLWYAGPRDGRPLILFLHGNGGSIGDRAARFLFYRKAGFGVLFLSFRGYGGSTGSASESGLVADAVAAYDWLQARGHRPDEIVLVGESLGTGVAVQLAGQRKAAAVALEAPYSSIAAIAASQYWYLPVRLLLKDQFDSLSRIRSIDAPLLISHGERDEIVPFAMGRELYAAAVEPKEFFAVPGAGHDVIADPRTWMREMTFFARYAEHR